MKLLPKAKGLGEVISAALLSLLIKAAAFKELYKLLKHEAADKSSVLRLSSLPLGSALKALLNLLIKASRAALNKEPNDYAKLHEALRINFCSKWC